jgi:hypothetical protein
MTEILLPTAPSPDTEWSPTFDLGRPVSGVKVGMRLDSSWRSYFTVVDAWEALLQADGAQVSRLVTGERVGPGGEQTRTDLDDWSRLVECGVVGLGN